MPPKIRGVKQSQTKRNQAKQRKSRLKPSTGNSIRLRIVNCSLLLFFFTPCFFHFITPHFFLLCCSLISPFVPLFLVPAFYIICLLPFVFPILLCMHARIHADGHAYVRMLILCIMHLPTVCTICWQTCVHTCI